MSRFCTGRGNICNKLHEERETIKRQREKFLYYTTPFDLFHEKKKKKEKRTIIYACILVYSPLLS